ncbi:death domain-containing protein CRADD [Scomber scombrus]|uniref:Death domain-containing protein CRADD n=1 Tax=Scomber scombrus TaxID=13677 RepID=A0AAV1QG31_SCOSC
MEPEHKELLRKHLLELSGQIQVSDTIVPFLFQENILTEAQVQLIQSLQTETQKSLQLLQLLPGRGPRAFPALLRALDDYSWVRDKLLLELQDSPGPETGQTGESSIIIIYE